MMKSSSDRIIEKMRKLLPNILREYYQKMIDRQMLYIIENEVDRFLHSIMLEEGYNSYEYIRVKVEQDSKDPTKVHLRLLPTSLEGIKFLNRLEEECNE